MTDANHHGNNHVATTIVTPSLAIARCVASKKERNRRIYLKIALELNFGITYLFDKHYAELSRNNPDDAVIWQIKAGIDDALLDTAYGEEQPRRRDFLLNLWKRVGVLVDSGSGSSGRACLLQRPNSVCILLVRAFLFEHNRCLANSVTIRAADIVRTADPLLIELVMDELREGDVIV